MPFLESLVTHASILIIIGISFGRYYAVCRPLQSYSTCSRSKSLRMVAILWILAASSAVPFMVMSGTESAEHHGGTTVVVCRTYTNKLWHKTYLIVVFCAFCALPLMVLSFVYSKIVNKIIIESLQMKSKHSHSKHSFKSKKQSILMLLGIVVLFFVCILPMRIVTFWIVFSSRETILNLGFEGYMNLVWVSRVLLYMNSAGNPLIYSICSEKFRKAFKKTLGIRNHNSFNRNLKLFASSRYSFVNRERREDIVWFIWWPMAKNTKFLEREIL